MLVFPVLLVLSLAVLFGVRMGLGYLEGRRPAAMMLGTHVMLGMGGLLLLVFARSALLEAKDAGGAIGAIAAFVVALTLMAGLSAAVVGGRAPERHGKVLAAHAALGGLGFLLFIVWMVVVLSA